MLFTRVVNLLILKILVNHPLLQLLQLPQLHQLHQLPQLHQHLLLHLPLLHLNNPKFQHLFPQQLQLCVPQIHTIMVLEHVSAKKDIIFPTKFVSWELLVPVEALVRLMVAASVMLA